MLICAPKAAILCKKFKKENRNYDDSFIEKYIEYLERETSLDRIKVFIAKADDVIVGSMNLIIIPKSPKPSALANRIGYLTNSYVRSDFRNKGLGEKILKNVLEYSRNNRLEVIIVWPSERARSLYERCGFNSDNDILENIILPDEDDN